MQNERLPSKKPSTRKPDTVPRTPARDTAADLGVLFHRALTQELLPLPAPDMSSPMGDMAFADAFQDSADAWMQYQRIYFEQWQALARFQAAYWSALLKAMDLEPEPLDRPEGQSGGTE